MDTTKRATSVKVKRGPMGTFIEKGDICIAKFSQNYVKLNLEGHKKYEVGMGPVYSGLATIVPPMSQISIDLLAPIEVLCYPGSRQVSQIYPLIIGDLNFKSIEVQQAMMWLLAYSHFNPDTHPPLWWFLMQVLL